MAKEKTYTRRVTTEGDKSSVAAGHVSVEDANLIFGRKNYLLILLGIGLIFIGLALMSGGHMPSPEVWDESLIYSARRITLAPMMILLGLVINVYAIFAKK